MKAKSEAGIVLQDFIRDIGIPGIYTAMEPGNDFRWLEESKQQSWHQDDENGKRFTMAK
jgi:hypothetical protein